MISKLGLSKQFVGGTTNRFERPGGQKRDFINNPEVPGSGGERSPRGAMEMTIAIVVVGVALYIGLAMVVGRFCGLNSAWERKGEEAMR